MRIFFLFFPHNTLLWCYFSRVKEQTSCYTCPQSYRRYYGTATQEDHHTMPTFLEVTDQQGKMMYINLDDIACLFVNDEQETEIAFRSDPDGMLIARDTPHAVITGRLLHLGTD